MWHPLRPIALAVLGLFTTLMALPLLAALQKGTHYFAASAYDAAGVSSETSAVGSKVIK